MFNLIDPSQSDGYNPFAYIRNEADVLKLMDNLIRNTTPKNANNSDPFWEKAEIALDSALTLSLITESVFARYISSLKDQRVAASKVLSGPQPQRRRSEPGYRSVLHKQREKPEFGGFRRRLPLRA